jgi:hypothetical protein
MLPHAHSIQHDTHGHFKLEGLGILMRRGTFLKIIRIWIGFVCKFNHTVFFITV